MVFKIIQLFDDSSDDDTETILLDLLERSSTHLDFIRKYRCSFVFWSQKEGSDNDSSSAGQLNIIRDKIKSIFLDIVGDPMTMCTLCIGQFWAPVTINERRLLSTSGQPFIIPVLDKGSAIYRLDSEKYEYDIDVNKLEIEGDPKIKSGGPATTFLRRLPNADHHPESESCFRLNFCIMLPICFPSDQIDCVGVLGLTFQHEFDSIGWNPVLDVLKAIQKVGLDICNVHQHIPYEIINGLRPAKDKITHALEIVCKSHNLGLAQVWGAFEDKSHVPLSTNLEDTQRILGLKLTGYIHNVFRFDEFHILETYKCICDVLPLERTSKKHVLKTFQDFKPRYIYAIRDDDMLLKSKYLHGRYCAFAICLRSLETRDFNYLFEFIWPNYSEDSRRDVFLEAILLTIKKCLPSFKFASGAEIGDDLEVVEIGCNKEGQNTSLKIFQGKQPIVVDNIMAPSRVTCQTTSKVLPSEDMDNQDVICVTNPPQNPKVNHKTAKIFLTREVVENQFGKTMNEAAHNLKGNDNLQSYLLIINLNGRYCAFVICLRSLETRDFNYSFEFIWPNYSEDSRCDVFLEAILLTIKRCLPSFKFASGAEIGDQLEVVEVGCYKEGQNTCFKIFQGKQPIVVDNIMSPSKLVTCQTTSKVVPSKGMDNQCSDVICVTNPTQNPKVNQKTAKIFLTREVIEKQFGKTMNEAAHNLKDWPGPNSLKRKANDSCTTQIDTNEANATTQDPLPANINKKIMFIKAENADDMIKFNMPVSQATFASVEKTIGVKFKLCVGTFKLKYLDEDGDWILLTSDEEMNDCIHSLRKSDQILVRLRVLPTQEPISCSCG
ncbi:hypothetical protein E3N88_15127 [Mikania micrantha]|uniref:PB1 domain-containing protein n=1 Tax=Mikania micrantha TaxID=192012 RepID=A0A5N6NVY3_9ASTR|nr:hypothetical protein E3N88_15127 [Mikania micrantha]